ncbi:aldo/keto reductase [Vulgatibacter incomptus]|nr:aldo/keto reductase [Vulgatibacter incomptus]
MTRPSLTLNDGRTMPRVGFGTWRISNDQAASIVRTAISAGYRSIDTAAVYANEEGVGEAVATCGLPRDELFVTTKVWNDRQGYDTTLRAFDESLARLKLEAVDLYLIHWPAPATNRYVETWKALIQLRQEGRARSIGVSNFNRPHLERILDATGVVPAVNQIELHPFLQQRELRAFHADKGIATESWSPLARAHRLDNPVLVDLAKKHGKTPAQVVLRWHLDSGLVAIPKSAHETRIRENLDLFDFRLDDEDMARMETLDEGGRTGMDPNAFD